MDLFCRGGCAARKFATAGFMRPTRPPLQRGGSYLELRPSGQRLVKREFVGRLEAATCGQAMGNPS
jgi:hypothetical protein